MFDSRVAKEIVLIYLLGLSLPASCLFFRALRTSNNTIRKIMTIRTPSPAIKPANCVDESKLPVSNSGEFTMFFSFLSEPANRLSWPVEYTVEPLLSGHPLSGQLLKSRKYCQYNTVNKTPFKRPPLLSGRGHLSAVPMSVLLLFYLYLAANENVIYDI